MKINGELTKEEMNWILSQIAIVFRSFKNDGGTYDIPLSEQRILRSLRYKLRKEIKKL